MMVIWAPLTYASVVAGIAYFGLRPPSAIPVFVNGLVPSLPDAKNKEESGTTVLIYYSAMDPKDPRAQVFRGYADQNGCVRSTMPAVSVGKVVSIRIRHVAYKFQDFKLTVPRYGIIYTAKMELDGTYNGKIRGAPIHDLGAHYQGAVASADEVRVKAVNLARRFGLSLARIPVVLWPIAYALVIVSNAVDFFQNSSQFAAQLESFPHALYLSVATITSLGYAGSYPVTDLLRSASSVEAISGILLIGLFLNSLFYERHS